MDTMTTLPDWVNNAVYALVILTLAGLVFWLIASIVRKVLTAFKQANLLGKNGKKIIKE
jgi:hypothetical protein